MPRKIIRTGHHDTTRLEQAPANEGGIDDRPTSDCYVEPLSDNIGAAILQGEMHAHGRIPSHEVSNKWCDPPPPDWRGSGSPSKRLTALSSLLIAVFPAT